MTLKGRAVTLISALTLMLGVAACGEDDSAAPGERGDSPSAVGEPGSDASETGGGGTPAEGVDDENQEN